MEDRRRPLDYRFSLANKRTFLAWMRTAPALVASGVIAANAIEFNHEVWRWVVAAPPLVVGAALARNAPHRWRNYETTMDAGAPLPVGASFRLGGIALCVYALVALVAMVLDG